MNFIKQTSTATSGTVTCTNLGQDLTVYHDAASLAATLTVALPTNPIDGQCVTFVSTLGITALTISSALTIVGGLTTLAAAGYWTICYEAATNKWFRIG